MSVRLSKLLNHFNTTTNYTSQSCSVEQDPSSDTIHASVSEYYGKILQSSNDLKTNVCTTCEKPPPIIISALKNVPTEIKAKYYGCGIPIPSGITNLTILDLGCGTGQDCYIASQFVGNNGNVIGIDMTKEQLSVANKYKKNFCLNKMNYNRVNLEFIHGYIECLNKYIKPESIDLCISNCVINLSPKKDHVLKGVWDSLRYGGEFYFSDVYCDRRLSQEIRNNKILWGECISGALYIEDFRRICQSIGFKDIRILKMNEIEINDNKLKKLVGNAKFYSITYRLFKLRNIEDKCEDFGQIGIYKGGIDGNEHYYQLDDHHIFYKNKPMLVCGNTANMIGKSWLGKYFEVIGDMSTHYGLFDCSDGVTNNNSNSNVSNACTTGACC